MASAIKRNGVSGSLLMSMADRGGRMTSDYRGFPPAKLFHPLQRRGLVEMNRVGGLGRMRYTVWNLTRKGWDAIGRQPSEATL